MSDPFEIGRRVLAECRRLLAPPPLAGLPGAYASLLQDPGGMLEEAWGGPERGLAAFFERQAPTHKKAGAGRAPAGPGTAAATVEGPTAGSPFSPLNAAPGPSAPRGLVTSATPPSLPRVASPFSPASPPSDDNRPPFRPGTAPGVLPLNLVRAVQPAPSSLSAPSAPSVASPEHKAEPYGPERVYGEKANEASEKATKLVEWPAPGPSVRTALAGDASFAAPGNALQEVEERLGTDPELRRLRRQLGEDDGKRGRLQQARTAGTIWKQPPGAQGEDAAGPSHAAHTPTSFSPLSSLMNKNVARGNVVNVSAPPARAPEEAVPAPKAISGDAPGRAAGAESDEGRAGRDEPPSGAAPSVDEVLEELYERLRLEFLRTYGTTGG